ncbi:MAG: hypothetical protein LVQ75_05650 [Candidatus Babeliales bacterium]|jgi:hypothetical protein
MQKFFVASLFLMFSCYGAEEDQETRKAMPLEVVNLQPITRPLVKPTAQRPAGITANTLRSKSTTNLLSNSSPEKIAAIQAKAAATETAEAAERLQQTITQIIKKEQEPEYCGPNCAEKGTFKRKN